MILSRLFDDELIDMAIDVSRPPELPPVPGVKYTDPSSIHLVDGTTRRA